MAEHEEPAAPPRKTVDEWAVAKGVDAYALEGAVGRERAARRWPIHERPVVAEAEFDAAIAAFINISLG